jgi:hypothetical protein
MNATPSLIERNHQHGGSDRDEPSMSEILHHIASRLPPDIGMSHQVSLLDLPIFDFDGKVRFLVSIVRRG